MEWQTPVIFGLLSFAVVLTVMAAIDKWPRLRDIGATSLTDGVIAISPAPIARPPLPSVTGSIRVVDGDTVDAGGARYRLVGFDTPERGDLAKCDSERALAARATARLQEMVSAGARLARTACACEAGTEGTKRCNYGRLCGTLTVNGHDAGDILIGEGLAHRYVCSGDHCPRRPGWC